MDTPWPGEPDPAATFIVKLFVMPDALAVTTAVWAVLVLDAEALNVALDAPAAMLILAGTDTTVLLEARDIATADAVFAVSVTVHVDAAPELIDDGVQVSWESTGAPVGATSERGNVTLAVPAEAVIVAVWFAVTPDTLAVKDALIFPAATETLDGTVTFELLLLRDTGKLDDGALPPRLTVQDAVPGDCTVAGLHVNPVRVVV
jgi:hypothetical protein